MIKKLFFNHYLIFDQNTAYFFFMKSLIYELMYRVLYTFIAKCLIFSYVYLNYARLIESFWSLIIMDHECIDFCWFSILDHLQPLPKVTIDQVFDLYGLINNYQIAYDKVFFLCYLTFFIENTLIIYLTFLSNLMLTIYPYVIMIVFQNLTFWLPAMTANKILFPILIMQHLFLVLIVHSYTYSTCLAIYSELLIDHIDSELFASGKSLNSEHLCFIALMHFVLIFQSTFFFYGIYLLAKQYLPACKQYLEN